MPLRESLISIKIFVVSQKYGYTRTKDVVVEKMTDHSMTETRKKLGPQPKKLPRKIGNSGTNLKPRETTSCSPTPQPRQHKMLKGGLALRRATPITTSFHHARPITASYTSTSPPPATETLSPRWLSDVKQRIGHCITFGLKPAQIQEAGAILQVIARDWRELVAGSEGFLTSKERRSMYRLPVVWGEQDSMVRD